VNGKIFESLRVELTGELFIRDIILLLFKILFF